MFKKSKRIALFILCFFSLAGACYLLYIPDRHIKRYNRAQLEAKGQKQAENQQQVRLISSKDLYKSEGNRRNHTKITAPLSTLTLIPQNDKLTLVEKLTDMKCILEETNSESQTQVRHLDAKKGSYYFNQQNLVAEDVTLRIYKGVDEDKEPLPNSDHLILKGHATQATFDFSKEVPTFKAKKFKANIKSLEKK